MDEDERQRKLEAGRAKLASFRQKRAKGNSAGAAKKTQKGKGQAVSQNDRSPQDCHVEAVPPSANSTELNSKTKQEVGQKPKKNKDKQKKETDQAPSPDQSSFPVEDLKDEDLAALTGKEQLKLLQQAVEKRNDIIARLSANLQEALSSRDLVQLEAQSLAGQIQGLQMQLQQTSVEFLRIKTQSVAEMSFIPLQGHCSTDPNANHKEDCKSTDNTDSDEEPIAVLEKLKVELENEKEKSQHIYAELQKERSIVSLLEDEKKEREEEWKRNIVQLQDFQSQCLEMQQYKREKERLNIEVQELRKRLQGEGDAEKRFSEEAASSARLVRSLEEEITTLNKELESVRMQLEEREKELKFREEEVMGLKASKNKQNQAKAGFTFNEPNPGDSGDVDLDIGSNEDSMNVSLTGAVLMERYLFSEPPACAQSSLVSESVQQCSQLDLSADCSFELNSEVLGDHALLSISNRLGKENNDVFSPACLPDVPAADTSSSQSLFQWLNNSNTDKLEMSKVSEHSGGSHLENDLLYQQCRDLHEELSQKDRDLNVLGDEVAKSAEELEEARSRWAQVTEELREALLELEEEKEKRIHIEEEIQLKSHEQDELKNKLCALLEDKEQAVVRKEASPLQEIEEATDSGKQSPERGDEHLPTLQDLCENLIFELEETRKGLKTTADLVDQRTMELENTIKELENSQSQLLNLQAQMEALQVELVKSQASLDKAEKEKSDLESRIVCLSQNVANLEETQVEALQKEEEHGRKEEEMDERINKLEQILEEELEQFENLLKSKDAEMAEEKEKWEEERQEKEKELSCVRNLLEEHKRRSEEELKELMEKQAEAVAQATETVRKSYQQEISELKKKHQQETSELKAQVETRLLEQQVTFEEEQKRQINLIKQVTEREHERMMAELTTRHEEALDKLQTELSLELRESMETAHQAEMQQAQAQKMVELEALRLSLTSVHVSQLELSQGNLQLQQEMTVGKIQASMKESFAQERALLLAKHQVELAQIRRQNQEEHERLQQLHQNEMDKLKQQLEQERAFLEEKATKDMQCLRSQLEKEAHNVQTDLQTSLTDMQKKLSSTQEELESTRASLALTNKALTEAQTSLSQAQFELQESHTKLEDFHSSNKEQNQKLFEELQQVWSDRDAVARSLEELVCSNQVLLQEKEQHVLQLQGKERELQQEILNLQDEKALLKQNSEEEVRQLWTQLENMRTSRQELGELKEQLRARSAQVEDIERLKMEFNEQRREIKEHNEAELESLRRYFEQRLRAAEEGNREEIALLQLRLIEGALEETALTTDSQFSKCPSEEEKSPDTQVNSEEMFDSLRHQLEEKHTNELADFRSSLSQSFEEGLQQARADLTDHYYKALQEKKSRHALEMEQLKAKLSESHLRELTRIQLEVARQTEVEVEQRMWCHTEELRKSMTIIYTLENRLSALSKQHEAHLQSTQKLKEDFAAELAHLEDALQIEKEHVQERMNTLRAKHETELCALREELGKEKAHLEKALQEEKNKFTCLEAALDSDNSPQVLNVRQRLEAQYENELQKAKRSMEEEVKNQLQQAQEKFQDEKTALEHCLSQKYELSLAEIKEKHQAELAHEKATTLTKHSQEMDALNAKYKAQLDALCTSHRDRLAAMAAELQSKHSAELVALEAALHSQRKLDLTSLEAAFQETSQAQLEAQEAELERKYQEERDELESRMLGNMDTLEATYLKEVQTLRDEMIHLEQRHCQDLFRQKSEHEQKMERTIAEQLSMREELRKELTQMHMEKLGAMAAELSHVHKFEFSSQKEALDAEHCQALEALKKQVLELEQQHSAALQELTSTYAAETHQLTKQHSAQLQELKNISARELEACRRELEEESSRQRQHFTEEVELLKIQSEERLQGRINQLKTEFEEQKEAELEDLRRRLSSEQEEKEQSYTSKMSQLTAQLEQLDAVVAQLREEVGCLQRELEGKRSEMETLDTLLQRRERESQEGGNLLKMLTDDLQAAKEERSTLLTANEKLKKVVVEMVRSIIATEELIGQKISGQDKISTEATHGRRSMGNKESAADLSSEDLELTHTLCESLLLSELSLTPGGEEAALAASDRLYRAVGTLLDLLNQANTQLEETHNVHLSLEKKFSQGRDDSAQFIEQHKLLIEQLNQEAKQKSQLQLELHKSEGLLQGYVAEKAILEESLQQKEAQEERLVEELEGLKVKLHKMQNYDAELELLRRKHQELSEEHAILLRQKERLSADLPEREKALLAEVEHLAQDRLDLQRQAEKDHSSLSQRIRALERELEEQETKGLETEQHHKTHTEDLHQRVQALEKQLKHNRQFIEEQAVEREHERDEFQQEIKKLETRLRQSPGVDNKGLKFEDLVLQVENLHTIIKDKTEDHVTLLGANQQAQRDLAERNEEIDKLAGRMRELEQALLNSAETSRSVSQLEQELHKAMLREQELTQDKQALEQQQLANRLQISALQSKLDETRHCYQENSHDPTQELRDELDTAQQNLQSKEQEVEVLLGQLETVQRDFGIKEAELKHLTLQLELITNQNKAHVNELEEQIAALKENVAALLIYKEEKEGEIEAKDAEEDTLPSALLLEKNFEIDHLHDEIQRLEQELDHSNENKALEVEELRSQVEDLRSQVEHLQSEILRVRQDKQEEEERLHEVISTLQAELATLGPNLHEVSDSQDGDSINPSPAPSPEPQLYTIQELERKARPHSLKQELGLSYSATTRSLRSRLKGLQSQLETAVAEKEGLERLLLTQEEEYRGHGEEFGKRLKVEREKVDELQGVLTLKETELQHLKVQVDEERDRVKLLEEQKDSFEIQAQNAAALREETARLSSLVVELQGKEKERLEEIETLKTKEQEMKMEMGVLRETGLTLERQVQEVRAELVDLEAMVAEERTRVKTLETVKEELSSERDALKRREALLQKEIVRLQQEMALMKARIEELTAELGDKEAYQEEAQKEVLTHAELTLAKAEAVLKQKEFEQDALTEELDVVKLRLGETTEKAAKLQEEAQCKDQALADLESHNQQLKAELQGLQEDLAAQEEELTYQQQELEKLRQRYQHDRLPVQTLVQKDSSHRAFEDVLSNVYEEVSLGSPEVLRRLECSEDRLPERLHTSVLDSRLSELSALNSSALDLPQVKTSPRVLMEPHHSRTITPEPVSGSTHSPRSGSDNFSTLDSLDTDKAQELEGLTTLSSPLGSSSSRSAPEWASDGYGSNVSSELGARLRLELEQTERLDAQFVEYLRCRGINPTVNTDSAAGSMSYSEELLAPELQGLLRRVYQESCRILALSQRHNTTRPVGPDLKALSPSQVQHQSLDGSLHQDDPPMSWQQEKRALQETVIALRELLCRMAQRHNNADTSGPLQEGHVEFQLRAELEERQKEIQCAHSIQQEQKNKIQTLRLTVEESEEALRRERSKVQMLQQELEQERTHSLRKDQEDGERREAEHLSSEQQRSELMALKGQVEQERVACSNLRQELQIEQSRSMLLEKRLDDNQKELEKAHEHSAQQQDKSHLEHLLTQAESRLTETHSKLADAHRKLDEERSHSARQLEELSHRHETDAARERKFISDLRTQLDQERRQSEELAVVVDRLRAELLQSRRKWEEEERSIREELHREQEAAARQRVALESLKEQKQEACVALEAEKSLSKRQGVEMAEMKERLQLLKSKEREREEQWDRERRKIRQDQLERDKQQQNTYAKLCELELLRQQDKHRLQELQRTLAELEREERQMATQRLAGNISHVHTDSTKPGNAQHDHQASSTPSSSGHLEKLLKENSELREQTASLSQERAGLKQKLIALDQQLRRTENRLSKAAETENRPVNDPGSHSKMQRLYERYLRAESFRKALVYQKRYLLLLIGGFQQCEQATLCLIANMGARPSPPLSSQLRPNGRFRVAVCVVIAVLRMKFLTRKWHKAIRRFSPGSISGQASGSKADILRQLQPNLETFTNRETASTFVPPNKPSFRLHNRSLSSSTLTSVHTGATSLDPERSLTEYIQHLEKVQHRLTGARARQGSPVLQPDPKKSEL